jgi:hypothetical protein
MSSSLVVFANTTLFFLLFIYLFSYAAHGCAVAHVQFAATTTAAATT